MLRKGVNSSTARNWMLLKDDENIENVELVILEAEVQRQLGCELGIDVFLEYPWAYVPRNMTINHVKQSDTLSLGQKENLQNYTNDFFLIGYSSLELVSQNFVICTTIEARDSVRRRNKNISKYL